MLGKSRFKGPTREVDISKLWMYLRKTAHQEGYQMLLGVFHFNFLNRKFELAVHLQWQGRYCAL